MLIAPPSLSKPYTEFYSRDPALLQLPENADEKTETLYAERRARARETGDWGELLVAGATPTAFSFVALKGDHYRTLMSMFESDQIGTPQLFQLTFRCALVKIENAGDLRVTPEQHPRLGTIAASSVTDALDAIDVKIVNELGSLILNRARGLAPHR